MCKFELARRLQLFEKAGAGKMAPLSYGSYQAAAYNLQSFVPLSTISLEEVSQSFHSLFGMVGKLSLISDCL